VIEGGGSIVNHMVKYRGARRDVKVMFACGRWIFETEQVLHEELADSKCRPCPLLVKYVEAGWLGRKTQRGFYDYRGEKPVPTR